ncbi:MAG: DNA-processing protein DprA [Bacteroidota bacterium]|nr:DNA-processing protein DprA [Bacteroidota bacterium]
MNKELLYRIALTLIPHIGPVQAKILLQQFEPEEIFRAKKSSLEKIEGIGSIRANSIHHFDDFKTAEEEMAFIKKYTVRPVFITDKEYPQRLLNCYDSPTLLYFKGEADLNASKIIAVVGTRNHTEYGRQLTEKLINDLLGLNIMVLSGLAYGIDGIAHKAAIKNNISTIGVLAHGLDLVYPPQHTGLAKDMIRQNGGLLTEFRSKTNPDKHNFPARNRVVAGMSDAVIVVETGVKGGSMITAELANGYNKDVFAFPGRVTDSKSGGCNYLIKNNKAVLLTEAGELLELMNWKETPRQARGKKQKELFIELSADEKIIVSILKEKETVHIDEINLRSGLSSSATAAAILNLELQNIVFSHPGKRYSLQ